jgi:hypothetical protein
VSIVIVLSSSVVKIEDLNEVWWSDDEKVEMGGLIMREL